MEDDPCLLSILATSLEGDFEVLRATGGFQAITAISGLSDQDFVVTDFDLGKAPVPDGLEIARAVRARSPRIPVIILTGTNPSNVRLLEALALPLTFYLAKPFSLRRLMGILERLSPQSTGNHPR